MLGIQSEKSRDIIRPLLRDFIDPKQELVVLADLKTGSGLRMNYQTNTVHETLQAHSFNGRLAIAQADVQSAGVKR
ncbi:MAG TPA: hypothetical protein DIW47_06055 [Bacteroidetes bacterium]|nr:hypothetical protein [Bacteroidota bacterium]